MKLLLQRSGIDCGEPIWPRRSLTAEERNAFRERLRATEFGPRFAA